MVTGGKEEENQSGTSPREQVRQALECMVAPIKDLKSFSRWSILDYSTAYNSKVITPTKVYINFYFYSHRKEKLCVCVC